MTIHSLLPPPANLQQIMSDLQPADFSRLGPDTGIAGTTATMSDTGAGAISSHQWLDALNPAVSQLAFHNVATLAPDASGFADAVRSGTPGFDYVLAAMSSAAYDPANASIPGWEVAGADQLPPGFAEAVHNDPDITLEMQPDGSFRCTQTGLEVVVFTDGRGNYVAAFAGTNEPLDWFTNVSNATGGQVNLTRQGNRAYDQGIGFVGMLNEYAGPGHLVVTGHSLGGGLAASAAWVHGIPAVTFNAAGASVFTLDKNGADNPLGLVFGDEEREGLVRNHVLEGDPLTWLQEYSLLAPLIPDGAGETIIHDNATADSWLLGLNSPLELHGIAGVMTAMETQVPTIASIDTAEDGGTLVTVRIPAEGNIIVEVVVEFAGDAEGQAAAGDFIRDFPLTGQVPNDGPGTVVSRTDVHLGPWSTGDGALQATIDSNSAQLTEHADGSRTISVNLSEGGATLEQDLHYRPDGTLERIETTVQYNDGATLTIHQDFDTNGEEVLDDRRYHLHFLDHGGNPVVLVLDEAGMQELNHTTVTARDNAGWGLPMLDSVFGEDGSPLVGEGNIGFAISLVRTEGNDAQAGMADYLLAISTMGDGDNNPRTSIALPGELVPADPDQG